MVDFGGHTCPSIEGHKCTTVGHICPTVGHKKVEKILILNINSVFCANF